MRTVTETTGVIMKFLTNFKFKFSFVSVMLALFFSACGLNFENFGYVTPPGAPAPTPSGATIPTLVQGQFIDSSGNYLIADKPNQVIREVTGSTGVITTVAGNGSAGYSGDGGPATSASLQDAYAAIKDSAGNIYISDTGNNVIRKVDAQTGIITTIAGNGGQGFAGGGIATSVPLNLPYLLTLDPFGNLIFPDESNIIWKLNLKTNQLSVLAGSSSPLLRFAVDPTSGVADGLGNLYISGESEIIKYNLQNKTFTVIAGTGTFGYSGDGGPAIDATLNGVAGPLALDGAGLLYFSDGNANVVRKIDLNSGIISTIAGNGTAGYSGDGFAATSAELDYPNGVALDGANHLYIADSNNCNVRQVDLTSGIITTIAGNGICGDGGDNGPASASQLSYVEGIATDSSGNIFIADAGNSLIRKIDHSTRNISTVAGTISNASIGSGDGGLATVAVLNSPDGVAVDNLGNLFIADAGDNVVRKVDASSGIISTFSGSASYASGSSGDGGPATSALMFEPQAVSVDNSGNVFISDYIDNDLRLREVSASTGLISTLLGGSGGGYSGDGGLAINALIYAPIAVVSDLSGNIFISDLGNNVIRRVDAKSGIITTVAGNGNAGYTGDGGAATSATFHFTTGIAVDSAGNLFIVDAENYVVRKVSANTGIITTVVGDGQGGYAGDGGPATSAKISLAISIAVDAKGNLFIFDYDNYVVREVAATTGFISTIAGNGTDGYSGDNGPATAAEL
jgi:sugar lactone lactonase YvrE